MNYCEGKYCLRKDSCAYHEEFEWKYPRQYLDMSTEGYGYEGFDKDGNRVSRHEFFCGDRSEWYKYYKALGWRKGQEYRNSEGTICDEECLTCAHSSLCYSILEFAGMVFQPGDRVRFDCESIKANPEGKKKWLEDQLAEWEKQIEEARSVMENV